MVTVRTILILCIYLLVLSMTQSVRFRISLLPS